MVLLVGHVSQISSFNLARVLSILRVFAMLPTAGLTLKSRAASFKVRFKKKLTDMMESGIMTQVFTLLPGF